MSAAPPTLIDRRSGGRLARAAAVALAEGVVAVLPLLLLARALVALLAQSLDVRTTVAFGIGLLVAALAHVGLALAGARLFDNAVALAAERVRFVATAHLDRVPLAVLEARGTDRVASLLGGELAAAERSVSRLGAAVVPRLGEALTILVAVGATSLPLAVALLAGLLVALPIQFTLAKLAYGVERSVAEGRTKYLAGVVEYVRGLETLRAFAMVGQRFRRLFGSAKAMRPRAIKAFAVPLGLGTVAGFLTELGLPLMVALGFGLVLRGRLPLAAFILPLVLAPRFFLAVRDALDGAEELSTVRATAARLREIVTLPTEAEAGADVPAGPLAIELDGVAFAYGDRAVLHDVTCAFPPGSITAVVGPSGAGKTTLVQLLAGLREPSAGTIRVGGTALADLAPSAYRRRVALVSQDVFLFRTSIRENIRSGAPGADDAAVARAAREARLEATAARFPAGLETVVGEGGTALSGGERARVAIARALVRDAQIVVLDEPTAGLDVEDERHVHEAIDALLSRGRTVVVVTHALAAVRDVERIVVLEDGTVVEAGRHAELVATGGLYARLWERSTGARRWRSAAVVAAPDAS